MSYDYTDGGGYVLHVHPHLPGPAMEIATPKGTVRVGPDEAPALALAILEAAGVTPSLTASLDCPEHYERRALAHLETARKLRVRKAELEAEDLKVADYFTKVVGLTLPFIDDRDRKRYRAARDYFAKEDQS